MEFNPSKNVKADHPVEQVNYFDIQQFIKKSGGACRLPTEAEWEYAARGHARTRYFWGNVMDGSYAWFEDNSDETTHPVGQKKPNQFGLHDMMGNVWEWTEDWFSYAYYKSSPVKNPKGPTRQSFRVIRGASWMIDEQYTRVTTRHGGMSDPTLSYWVGVRCAKSL